MHPSFPRGSLLISLSVLLAAGIGGCGKKEEPKAAAPAASTAPAPAAAPVTPAPAPVPATPAPAPKAAAPAPAALASADADQPGVRVEVTELKRGSGEVVTLKFTFINDSGKNLDFGYSYGDPNVSIPDFSSVGGVHLVDAVNKKKYLVVRDSSDKKCVCSRELRDLPTGSRLNLWAKLPAPPAEVQKINVVIPHFGPMDDVPISQ